MSANPRKPSSSQSGARRKKRGKSVEPRSRQPIPSAWGSTFVQRGPKFRPTGSSITVQHTEMVATVTSATTATGTAYNILPASAASFPWLSGLALNYSQYKWQSLNYTYTPACATTQAGILSICIVYDHQDTTPSSLALSSQMQGSVTTQAYNQIAGPPNVCCRAKIPPTREPMRVTTTTDFLAMDASIRNAYSVGKFCTFTTADTAVTTWGYIFANYSITLLEPAPSTLQG